LVDLKKEFGRGEEETVKAAELKRLEQENRGIYIGVQKSSKRKWV